MAATASALALALGTLVAGETSFTGSVATREQVTAPSEDSLSSTKDLPILESLEELNLFGRATLFDGKLSFTVDTSAFVAFGGVYADAKTFHGAMVGVDDHDVAALAPFIALSEYYVTAEPVEHVVLTVGKKRVTWGPAFAYSPTDLLNPPRDPTDPALQRAGFLHAQLDLPFDGFTVSALFAPEVLETVNAVPVAALAYPRGELVFPDRAFPAGGAPTPDDALHYAAALRGYALIGDADVNAWILFEHRYGDDREDVPRLALTLSKNLFTIHEFHAEVLLQQGSARSYATHDCGGSADNLTRCAIGGTDIFDEKLKSSDRILPEILVGWRVMPDDGSMVSLEYLYQADGYTRTELGDVERLAAAGAELTRGSTNVPGSFGGPSATTGSEAPNRVAFQPRRRHYLFFSYTKPQVLDDFTLGATAIVPLEDLSALVSASVAWQATEWLRLTLFGFVPLPSPARVSVDIKGDPWQRLYDAVDRDWQGFIPRGGVVDGLPVGEFDGAPFRALAMFEARAYF